MTHRLRVLDLFAGLKGWSEPWAAAGHDVETLEIEAKFSPSICADILEWDYQAAGRFDVILASPPCQGFSVMNIGRNWTRPTDDPPHAPKTDKARLALRLVERTLEIIAWNKPFFWVIENPRAKLRKMPIMEPFERRTVTYCKFGETRMKPTDLWSDRWPPSLALAPPCSNGDACHTSAPRGSRTGTQGMDSAESAKIPALLSQAIMDAVISDWRPETRSLAIGSSDSQKALAGTKDLFE